MFVTAIILLDTWQYTKHIATLYIDFPSFRLPGPLTFYFLQPPFFCTFSLLLFLLFHPPESLLLHCFIYLLLLLNESTSFYMQPAPQLSTLPLTVVTSQLLFFSLVLIFFYLQPAPFLRSLLLSQANSFPLFSSSSICSQLHSIVLLFLFYLKLAPFLGSLLLLSEARFIPCSLLLSVASSSFVYRQPAPFLHSLLLLPEASSFSLFSSTLQPASFRSFHRLLSVASSITLFSYSFICCQLHSLVLFYYLKPAPILDYFFYLQPAPSLLSLLCLPAASFFSSLSSSATRKPAPFFAYILLSVTINQLLSLVLFFFYLQPASSICSHLLLYLQCSQLLLSYVNSIHI